MTLIPKSKFGDCSNPECNATNTHCVKVGKSLYCIKCRDSQKRKKQILKAEERDNSRMGGEDLSNIIEDLDAVFSQYIRLKYADSNGRLHCYTCSESGHWKDLDCGHFISRSHYGLRWEAINAKPQCRTCNRYKDGNIKVYLENLEYENPGIVEQLKEMERQVYKPTRTELKEMLIEIRQKVTELKKIKK